MPGRKNKRVSPKPPNVDTIKAMGLPVPEVLQSKTIKPAKKNGNGNGAGRPPILPTPELIKTITGYMATGKSLPTICKLNGVPSIGTLFNWLGEGEEEGGRPECRRFLKEYIRAREQQADYFFEEVSETRGKVETGIYEAHQARIIFDILRWQAGKLKPSKYGEKLQVEQDTAITIQVVKHTDAITINPGQNALITNNNND